MFCTRHGSVLVVHPQKNPKDTNICKKAAKEGSINYRLLRVKKDQFAQFLSKDLNNKFPLRERDVASSLQIIQRGPGEMESHPIFAFRLSPLF